MEVSAINSTPTPATAQQQTANINNNSNKTNSTTATSNDNLQSSTTQIILTNLATTTTITTTTPSSNPAATTKSPQGKPTSPSSVCEKNDSANMADICSRGNGQLINNSLSASNTNGTSSMVHDLKHANHDSVTPFKKDTLDINPMNNIKNNGYLKLPVDDIKFVIESLLDRIVESDTSLTDIERPTISNATDTSTTNITTTDCTETNSISTASVSQSSSFIESGAEIALTTTSLITPVHDLDEDEAKTKDIVTLRNLEITPPPPPPPSHTLPDDEEQTVQEPTTPNDKNQSKSNRRNSKRTHSESTEKSDDLSTSGGRSKRQRKQTQLFQVEDTTTANKSLSKSSTNLNLNERTPTSKRRTSSTTTSSTPANKHTPSTKSKNQPEHKQPQQHQEITQQMSSHNLQDVIFYEKNDYLAIRNEENTFYLCQLTENVRVQRPQIKVRWLDTKDGGQTYFLTAHYDKVPQKSIIMPVILNKLKSDRKGEQIFSLDDEHKENIMERLRRSLNIPSESEQ